MTTAHEDFWNHTSFAFVAHSARKPFPRLSHQELKKQGKKVFAVDPSVEEVEGDATPEALEPARERGFDVRTGTCAVMYVKPGLSYHSVHRWINRALGKY